MSGGWSVRPPHDGRFVYLATLDSCCASPYVRFRLLFLSLGRIPTFIPSRSTPLQAHDGQCDLGQATKQVTNLSQQKDWHWHCPKLAFFPCRQQRQRTEEMERQYSKNPLSPRRFHGTRRPWIQLNSIEVVVVVDSVNNNISAGKKNIMGRIDLFLSTFVFH